MWSLLGRAHLGFYVQILYGTYNLKGVIELMRKLVKKILKLFRLFGINPLKFRTAILNLPRFLGDLRSYNKKKKLDNGKFHVTYKDINPQLTNFEESAGTAKGHYFHQDLWAARNIYSDAPSKHYDVGSRIDGFIAHLLTFTEVVVIDIRDLKSNIEGLTFIQDNATDLSEFADNSINSLSSLHAVEHFGLGRYGDPINPQAPREVMAELERVLKPGGKLYFSVPVGKERLCFNAHRIFSPGTILDSFSKLQLEDFAAVNDEGDLQKGIKPEVAEKFSYGCGLFKFSKPNR